MKPSQPPGPSRKKMHGTQRVQQIHPPPRHREGQKAAEKPHSPSLDLLRETKRFHSCGLLARNQLIDSIAELFDAASSPCNPATPSSGRGVAARSNVVHQISENVFQRELQNTRFV